MKNQKIVPISKTVDVERRLVEVIISDETPDRDGDIVSLGGWDLENYRKNPVVFWGHEHWAVPIASATVDIEGGKLIGRAQFPEPGRDLLADQVFNAVADGRVRSVSAGFRARKAQPISGAGNLFLEQELLEFSFVGIPSNTSAVITDAVKSWAESTASKKRASMAEKLKAQLILEIAKADQGEEIEEEVEPVDEPPIEPEQMADEPIEEELVEDDPIEEQPVERSAGDPMAEFLAGTFSTDMAKMTGGDLMVFEQGGEQILVARIGKSVIESVQAESAPVKMRKPFRFLPSEAAPKSDGPVRKRITSTDQVDAIENVLKKLKI